MSQDCAGEFVRVVSLAGGLSPELPGEKAFLTTSVQSAMFSDLGVSLYTPLNIRQDFFSPPNDSALYLSLIQPFSCDCCPLDYFIVNHKVLFLINTLA